MKKPSKNVVLFIVSTAIMLGTVATWGRVRFGSLKAALLYTGGVRVFAEPNAGSVGELVPQTRASAKFGLFNFSDRTISVYGSKSSCTCLVVDDLPKSIPAGGRGEVEIAYRAGRVPGDVRQSVVLLTDAETAPQIMLTLTGRVVGESARKGDETK